MAKNEEEKTPASESRQIAVTGNGINWEKSSTDNGNTDARANFQFPFQKPKPFISSQFFILRQRHIYIYIYIPPSLHSKRSARKTDGVLGAEQEIFRLVGRAASSMTLDLLRPRSMAWDSEEKQVLRK